MKKHLPSIVALPVAQSIKILGFNGLPVIGFCNSPEGEDELKENGVTIILSGFREGEGLDAAIDWLRGRPGYIAVAEDLRCLGNQSSIFATVKHLAAKAIQLLDVRDLAADVTDLIQRALHAIRSAAGMGCHKTAQRRGRKGGVQKKENAARERAAILRDDIIRRICSFSKLTWADRCWLLDMKRSTLIRNYT